MGRIHVEGPAVHELTEINAAHNPDRLAVLDNTKAITWSEFEEQSLIAADAFSNYVRQGDRVAYLCGSSVNHAVLWNGAMMTGAIVSHVHTRASPETVRYCVDELQPAILVIDEAFSEFVGNRVWDEVNSSIKKVVVIGEAAREYEQPHDSFLAGAEPTRPDVLIEEDDTAAIWWTSGTTGRPKGWCHTHRTITMKGKEIARTQALNRTHTSLGSFSPSFAAWYNVFTPVLVTGATMVFLNGWAPEKWARMAEEHDATHAGLVPTMWRAVLQLDLKDYDFSTLKHITFTGEKIDRTTLERLQDDVCENVSNAYASTEVNVTTMYVEEMQNDRIESVGKPSGGTRVRIVEEGGNPEDVLPTGEVGEIVIKAPDCPAWVWGDIERTHAQFVDGWWYPGDMGYVDKSGYLFVEGRSDFMIKSKGVKVFPGPIEEVLNNHPGVEEAVVVGLEDREYGEMVTAVVNRSDPSVLAKHLDEWCLESDSIARFERPREYQFVDFQVPRTATGKLDRASVRDRIDGE